MGHFGLRSCELSLSQPFWAIWGQVVVYIFDSKSFIYGTSPEKYEMLVDPQPLKFTCVRKRSNF